MEKPKLFGVALKPEPENMSKYCRITALNAFKELVNDLNAKYLVVSYNNTYSSKSSSSENKIKLEEIKEVLKSKGRTKVFNAPHKFFNAGKTDFKDHKEYLFITKVNENKFLRSPLFYVGDKYKLLPEITTYFPNDINQFIEPFVGGGSVFLNVNAKKYLLNDLDNTVIDIHQYLSKQSVNPELFFNNVEKIIKEYGLSRSYLKDIVPIKLKKEFVKTYYSKFNKRV